MSEPEIPPEPLSRSSLTAEDGAAFSETKSAADSTRDGSWSGSDPDPRSSVTCHDRENRSPEREGGRSVPSAIGPVQDAIRKASIAPSRRRHEEGAIFERLLCSVVNDIRRISPSHRDR